MVGIEWDRPVRAGTPFPSGEPLFGDGAFVIVGESGEIRFSTDASLWSEPTSAVPGSDSWQAVAFGNGRFVAVGENGVVAFADAADLDNWTSPGSSVGGRPV